MGSLNFVDYCLPDVHLVHLCDGEMRRVQKFRLGFYIFQNFLAYSLFLCQSLVELFRLRQLLIPGVFFVSEPVYR